MWRFAANLLLWRFSTNVPLMIYLMPNLVTVTNQFRRLYVICCSLTINCAHFYSSSPTVKDSKLSLFLISGILSPKLFNILLQLQKEVCCFESQLTFLCQKYTFILTVECQLTKKCHGFADSLYSQLSSLT